MKINRDMLTGAALFLLGVSVFVMISSYPIPLTASYPGPKALPSLAGTGFILCGAGIFLQGVRTQKTQIRSFLNKGGWIRLSINFVILIFYIIGMKYLGYFIATPVLLFILSTWYSKSGISPLIQRVFFSVLVTIIIYLAYVTAFGYSLPMGFFE